MAKKSMDGAFKLMKHALANLAPADLVAAAVVVADHVGAAVAVLVVVAAVVHVAVVAVIAAIAGNRTQHAGSTYSQRMSQALVGNFSKGKWPSRRVPDSALVFLCLVYSILAVSLRTRSFSSERTLVVYGVNRDRVSLVCGAGGVERATFAISISRFKSGRALFADEASRSSL
jgi:hypothetical protein